MDNLAMKKDQKEMWMSALEVAMPLYTKAHFSTLESCVEAASGGADLSKTVEGKSAGWVKFVAEAAMRAGKVADDAMRANPEQLLDMGFDGLDDFSLATLAQVLFEKDAGIKDRGISDGLMARQVEAIAAILYSEAGHPLVDYTWMASDFIDYHQATEDMDELDILTRCLAQARYENDDANILSQLRRIGEWYLECNDIKNGCRVFAELITSNPLEFENYYSAGLELYNARHYDLAFRTADRGHHMLYLTGTKHSMADDLAFCVGPAHSLKGSESAVIDKSAEAALRKALETRTTDGTHLTADELARRIVPEIDQVPVKKFPTF